MDNVQFLDCMRNNLILVGLIYNERQRADDIPKDVRRALSSLQSDIVNAFHDSSIPFGWRRAVPAHMLPDLVAGVGEKLGRMKQQLAQLPDDARAEFAIQIRYEPVPSPEAFGSLTDRYRAAFTKFLIEGAVKDYDDGITEHVKRLHSAVHHFHGKVGAFDAYTRSKRAGERTLFRDTVVETVRTKVRVLRAANVGNDEEVERLCALAAFSEIEPAKLREDDGQRMQALAAAAQMIEALRLFLDMGPLDVPADED